MAYNNKEEKTKVLVIDDSRVVRLAATRMFDQEFEVSLGVDGADGLAILERDSGIHAVITDLAMPEMDGFELLEAIRSHSDENIRELPVIVATGAGNPESAKKKAFSLGATDFVTKPFNPMDLRARVRSYAKFRVQNKSLKEHATIDSLTGLMNTRGLRMQLNKDMSFAMRHESSLTLVAIEVDRYKDLFVRIGRAGTEKVVKRVASVLQDAFRQEDSIARVGIARYIVSMPMSLTENAMEMADRICHTIEAFQAKLDGKRIKMTVSVGIISVPVDSDTEIDTLLDMINMALERASSQGASQIHELSFDDYLRLTQEYEKRSLSIDALLEQIESGDSQCIAAKFDIAIDRLSPLFRLLSEQQMHEIMATRQNHGNNVVEISSSRNQGKH